MTIRHVSLALCMAAAAMLGPSAQAADIDGAWALVFQTEAGTREKSLHVATDGDKATATLGETELAGTYKDGILELEGEHHSPEAGYSATLTLTGKLAEGELRGDSTWGQHASTFVGTQPEE